MNILYIKSSHRYGCSTSATNDQRIKYREPQSFKWNHNFRIIMDAVESYARSWARTEGVDYNILSEWIKTVRNLVKRRVYILRNSMAIRYKSVFNDKYVAATLSDINYMIHLLLFLLIRLLTMWFLYAIFYIQCLINELGIAAGGDGNDTYHRTAFSKEDILSNHESAGQGSKGINFSGWHGLDMSVTVTKRR